MDISKMDITKIDMSKLTPEQIQQLEELKNKFKTFDYYPSLAMNGVLLSLFAISLIIFTIQGIRYRTWPFMIVMCLGCASKSTYLDNKYSSRN